MQELHWHGGTSWEQVVKIRTSVDRVLFADLAALSMQVLGFGFNVFSQFPHPSVLF